MVATRFTIGDGFDMHTRRWGRMREHWTDADRKPHARVIEGIGRRAANPVCGKYEVPTRSLVAALPVGILVNHGGPEIGEITFVRVTEHEVFVRGFIHDSASDAWARIASGELGCLSLGAVIGGGIPSLLLEVSVCA